MFSKIEPASTMGTRPLPGLVKICCRILCEIEGEIVGGLTTNEGLFAHHARVVMSRAQHRVFAADGASVIAARLPEI